MDKDFKVREIERALDDEHFDIQELRDAIVNGKMTLKEAQKYDKRLHWSCEKPYPPDDKLILMNNYGEWVLKDDQ